MKTTKKYFAQYVPIPDSRIERGDIFFADPLIEGDLPDICSAGENVDLDLVNMKGYKKVKLFLCTRDIEIGDEFYNNLLVKVDHVWDEEDIEDDNQLWLKQYHFKIIGEIFSDQKWIEEGDEFSEDEVIIEYKTFYGRSKNIEEGQKIIFSENGGIQDHEGEVYKIELNEEGCWDWEDKIYIKNARRPKLVNGVFIYEEIPDLIVPRRLASQFPKIEAQFQIKGPCGHFH